MCILPLTEVHQTGVQLGSLVYNKLKLTTEATDLFEFEVVEIPFQIQKKKAVQLCGTNFNKIKITAKEIRNLNSKFHFHGRFLNKTCNGSPVG